MKNLNIEYAGTDQNFQDVKTIVWFDIDDDKFGVAFSTTDDPQLVDCDGATDTDNDQLLDALKNMVTDHMLSA